MNLASTVLLLHILGATVLGGMLIQTLITLYQNQTHLYKKLAKYLALTTGFQLISGSVLTLTTTTPDSLLHFCGKIGLYLIAVAIAETALFKRMQEEGIASYPLLAVSSSITTGILITFLTAISIY